MGIMADLESQLLNPKEHITTATCIHLNYFGDKWQKTKLKMTLPK